MRHCQVARVEPPSPERLLRRCGILQVTFHHDVSAFHDLAQRLAVGRDRLERFGVRHHQAFQHRVGNALAGFEFGLLLDRQRVPFLVPGTDRGRAVDFGQPVDMGDVKPHGLHGLDHGRRRRRACGHGPNRVIKVRFHIVRGMDQ